MKNLKLISTAVIAVIGLLTAPLSATASTNALQHIFTVMDTQVGAPWNLDQLDGFEDSNYSYKYSGIGTDVYVVDTGVDSKHPELSRVSTGFDAFGSASGQTDCHGHGTHVAGVISGKTYGVAKGATIVPVRVLNCAGLGTTATLTAGIDWILSNFDKSKVSIVNMSLGGPKDIAVNSATEKLVSAGLVVVAAAGNSNVDACTSSPASAIGVIAVGATDQSKAKAAYSNWGNCVSIFAPGTKIPSASPFNYTVPSIKSGTSQAASVVSGVLASYASSGAVISSSSLVADLLSKSRKGVVLGGNSVNNNFAQTIADTTNTGIGPIPPAVVSPSTSSDIFILNVTATSVSLSWSPSDKARYYSVKLGRSGEAGYVYVANTTRADIVIPNLYSNTNYKVLITPISKTGAIGGSVSTKFYAPYGLPSAPKAFTIRQDVLKWSPPTYNGGTYLPTYIIEHRVDGVWSRVAETSETSYKTTRPDAGVSVEYRVAASTPAGVGVFTAGLLNVGTGVPNVVSDVTDLPRDIAGSVVATQRRAGSGMVSVSWAPVAGISSYVIESSPLGSELWKTLGTTTATSRVVTAQVGVKLMIKVTAILPSGSTVVGTIQYEGTP
jgi:subtilisin family serine protease